MEESLKVSSKMMNVNSDDLTFPMIVIIKEREQRKGFGEYIKEDRSNITLKDSCPVASINIPKKQERNSVKSECDFCHQ